MELLQKPLEGVNIASWIPRRLHPRVRTDARFVRNGLIVAAVAGVFPDAISHGVILAGRDGHLELLIISALGIVAVSSIYIYLWAYSGRYNSAPSRPLELVENEN